MEFKLKKKNNKTLGDRVIAATPLAIATQQRSATPLAKNRQHQQ